FVAVGGPNFPPPEPSLVPAAGAVSPGGPMHGLLNDEGAEHIPGCNMAFTKEALREGNGFEPIFSPPRDDLPFFRPPHHPRRRPQTPPGAAGAAGAPPPNHVNPYLTQPMGYGKAQALLHFTHPPRFNPPGQPRWPGRIYGELTRAVLSRRPVIYFGAFGRGLF